ncbi:MAG: hypothetical protein PVJ72_13110, partial [Gammaproteobacteria bacterium]
MRYIKSTIARPGPYILAIILLSLTACGNDGSSDAPGTTTVSGVASKGPIHGGTVTVFSLQADGGKGAQLGTPATTAADGAFSVTLGEYSGNVILEISGG